MKKYWNLLLDNALNIFCMSVLTGLFSGVIITMYNVLMSIGEHTAETYYALLIENPAFIPVLFSGLAAGAIVIGTVVRFEPMVRGSGIPQIEGAARGVIRFKWYVTLCTMFAASLACVFMGYPAGAEGPSLEMGGCCGSATGTLLKRNQMVRRMQIASGSSAGLAVAFNAPITGVVFAMEEAFRSFSPQVFICASISVVTALVTRNALRPALGQSVGFAFEGFVFPEVVFDSNFAISCLWLALAALLTSLVGVAFYYSVFGVKKLFKKITFFKKTGKFIIPFTVAGAFGLISLYSLGGGHALIVDLATGGTGEFENFKNVFGLSLAASLAVICLFRFITAVMTMGCGVPCGVFIPMLAIGSCLGALLSVLFQRCGMDPAYSDYLVIVCMASFFTCIVKAPITGMVMVFELTGQYTNFLPALIVILVGYVVGFVFRTEPIYEKNLDMFIEEEKIYEKFKKVRISLFVMHGSKAANSTIRRMVWPSNGLVVSVTSPDGTVTVPDGETVLSDGDNIIFECETDDENELREYLYAIVGKQN